MAFETCVELVARARRLWAYLIRREERRQAVEMHYEDRLGAVDLENAKNAGTIRIIEKLEYGGRVTETEPNGRSREVQMPERSLPERPLPPAYRVVIERPAQHPLDGPSYPGELVP